VGPSSIILKKALDFVPQCGILKSTPTVYFPGAEGLATHIFLETQVEGRNRKTTGNCDSSNDETVFEYTWIFYWS
jgi:hypothetical protein